jgi:hypothetical protein
VRRGEAEYPAVFDYGEMSQANVLAWDFAKLEGELTRVLLPPLLTNPAVRRELAEKTGLRPKPTREAGPPTEAAERADQLRAFLRFHELLHELTARVKDPSGAEIIRPLPHPPTQSEPVNRLLAIILRIRKEAALWLGFESPGRQYVWRDEYYFALAVQGLLNAKARWNYFPSQIECALVSAGVAVARMGETAALLRNAVAAGPAATGPFPSYRVPLAILHNLWAAGQRQEATDYAERVAVEPPDPVSPLRVRASARHAVPLQAEAILVQMEAGRAGPAEGLLNQELRPLAREFGDFETLGRLGRLFKEAGDRKWHESQLPFDHFRDSPGWQMYRYAQSVYAEAYEATEDRYVGINAATLALLTHDTEAATRYAAQIARSCADQHDTVKQDRYWLFATEGEASLVRGRPGVGDIPDAVHFYREALAELTPGQGAMANSSYRQLCRLWKALGAERVVPLLELFEAHPIARPALSIGFLGRQAAPPVVPSPAAGDS